MEFIISFLVTFLIGYWLLTHHYKIVNMSWDSQDCEYKKIYGKVDVKVWHLAVLLLISSIPIFGFVMVACIVSCCYCIEEERFYIINPNNKKKPSFMDKLLKTIVGFLNKPIK